MNAKHKPLGQIEVSFTYRQHLGPRFEQGSVRIRFDDQQPYSFSSAAVWAKDQNYERFVRGGVEQALLEKRGALEGIKVDLLAVEVDDIESTPHGFESAAYAATCAAFLV
jgi:hypothetical protein